MITIAIVNEKGGVGKSSTAVNLAACLQRFGKKVLMIDTDYQRNTSDTYRAEIRDVATLYDVLCDDLPIAEAIQHAHISDIVAGDPALRQAQKVLTGMLDFSKLRDDLAELKTTHNYDYCIIDTRPDSASSSILVQNALVAADELILPVEADRYSLQGVSDFKKTFNEIRKVNPNLKIAGILLTIVDKRTNLYDEAIEIMPQVAEALETQCFKSTIRKAQDIKNAQGKQKSVIEYKPKSDVASDYIMFTEELVDYLENR